MPKQPKKDDAAKLKAALAADPPEHKEHGEDSWFHPISENMRQTRCWNWRMEGNNLHCDTEFGPMMQKMPTNVICLGEKDGLPILKEI